MPDLEAFTISCNNCSFWFKKRCKFPSKQKFYANIIFLQNALKNRIKKVLRTLDFKTRKIQSCPAPAYNNIWFPDYDDTKKISLPS